ncbi:hydroxymethylglutaryl-CoA lyase [Pseudomarimonas arenosa]|uniref:hydroxymethylglutaryl-CoA lyase n=1 Tax=Pseudomarimonas arenosa TaxID=2774145 RepID=A0AAW3ZHT5_9GAMM|nr:hydroxymethylglutaryl-CoA lyase [Pseudomarimonas arenosa]MBD8524500.1 hydroxymethylglutaryl-CoA lyase [Pseudomarimonas arenosa]
MTDQVRVVDVGPRDGLQNEKQHVATATKIALIERLAKAGLTTVEATSFVSPKWVPQMADASEVFSAIQRQAGVRYPVLVPNEQGYRRAREVGVEEIAVFGAASEAFSQKNINASIAESLQRFEPVIAAAKNDAVAVRGYVSTVLGCPYQGAVPVADVVRVAGTLHRMGCYEISLGDTIGVGTPRQARAMLEAVAAEVPMSALAVHFHDTRGQALANVYACLEAGVRVVDASIAGLGGCPYAKGASGNLATEDLVYMLDGLGMNTEINLEALIEIARWINGELQRPASSRLALAGLERVQGLSQA